MDNKLIQAEIAEVLKDLCDPEIPVLTLFDLGVIREIEVTDTNELKGKVIITPTYSGCPAMDLMTQMVRAQLDATGYKNISLETRLHPAWTTDWMLPNALEKLKKYGIAPPVKSEQACHTSFFAPEQEVACPQCGSINTSQINYFGSTACKALYQCNACKEPFDYFKCH